MVTRVEVAGAVASRQGINLPNVTVSLPAVSEKDLELIDAGIEMGVDVFALSFVRRREDLDPVREHLASRGSDAQLFAKIEKPQAAANAEEILDAADGVMIARGDLGIELPIEEVPLVQKRILALAGRRAKPTITATQMLESMVHSKRPTRAEVADVANAIFDGTDAVMLSQETAVGQHPVEAVEMMAAIATTTERDLPYGRWLGERGPQASNQYHAISFGAVGAVYQLGLKAIVCPTRTGTTARLISAYRPRAPVLALSPNLGVGSPLRPPVGRHGRCARGTRGNDRPDRAVRPGGRGDRSGEAGGDDRDHGRPAARPQRRHEPLQGPHDRVEALGALLVALAVRARLRDVPAGLHPAPLLRAVLRLVVERPLAGVLGAGLEARPFALDARLGDDREQSRQRAVDPGGVGLELRAAAAVEAQPQPRRGWPRGRAARWRRRRTGSRCCRAAGRAGPRARRSRGGGRPR